MKKIVSLLVISIFVLIYSCSEDNPNSPYNYPPPPVKWSDYFPLKVGAYWIYETYKTDSNYVRLNDTATYDTILVDKIVTVKGKECYKILTNPGTKFPRDNYFYGEGSKVFKLTFPLSNRDTVGVWFLYTDFAVTNDTSFDKYNYYWDDLENDNEGRYYYAKTVYKNTDTVMTLINKRIKLLGIIEKFEFEVSSIWGANTKSNSKCFTYYIKNIGLGYQRNEYLAKESRSDKITYHSFSEKILIKYYIPK